MSESKHKDPSVFSALGSISGVTGKPFDAFWYYEILTDESLGPDEKFEKAIEFYISEFRKRRDSPEKAALTALALTFIPNDTVKLYHGFRYKVFSDHDLRGDVDDIFYAVFSAILMRKKQREWDPNGRDDVSYLHDFVGYTLRQVGDFSGTMRVIDTKISETANLLANIFESHEDRLYLLRGLRTVFDDRTEPSYVALRAGVRPTYVSVFIDEFSMKVFSRLNNLERLEAASLLYQKTALD